MTLGKRIEVVKEQLTENRNAFYKSAPFPTQYYLAAEKIVRFQLKAQIEILEQKIKDMPKLFNPSEECLNRGRNIGISLCIVELKKEIKLITNQLKQLK